MRKTETVLAELSLPAFVPLPLFSGGFAQTVAGAYWPQQPEGGAFQVHKISLGGPDSTTVAVDRPAQWKTGDRVALLVHGLAGSIHSTYMVRLARRLPQEGLLTVRMNLRNCGSAFGLSRKTYHAGLTDDPRAVLAWIRQQFPESPVTAIGFSLGGNMLLKMATEDASQPTPPLDSLLAISPATDLARSSLKLERAPGKWIAQLFMKELIRDVEKLGVRYPELPKVSHLRGKRIRDFDEHHVAKLHGFRGADDYYERCSSLPHLREIGIPTFILGAMDDPVVEFAGLSEAKLPAHVDVILTAHGGHVGFVGLPGANGGARWADTAIHAWMKKRLSI